MNLENLKIDKPEQDLWFRVTLEANAWRGHCLHCFAQVEASVTETLLSLSERNDSVVKLRHLFGQRLADLGEVIGPEGEFAVPGKKAFEALEAFRVHEQLRNILAHGVAKIAVDRQGKWVMVMRQLSIRGKKAERNKLAVEQEEAEQILADLQRTSQRLNSMLGNLRRRPADLPVSPCH